MRAGPTCTIEIGDDHDPPEEEERTNEPDTLHWAEGEAGQARMESQYTGNILKKGRNGRSGTLYGLSPQ